MTVPLAEMNAVLPVRIRTTEYDAVREDILAESKLTKKSSS